MKNLIPSFTAAALFAAALPASATPVVPPQVIQDVKQLVSDLEGIASHSSVDPADVEHLAADLQLFITGASKPSTDSVRKLADDALAALADGKLTTTEEFTLLGDLRAVLQSAGFTDDQIGEVVGDIESIVTSTSVTQADFKLVLGDLTALLADLQGTFLVSTKTFDLSQPARSPAGAAGKPVAKESGSDTATIISALRAAIGAEASVAVNTSSLASGQYKVSVNLTSTNESMALGSLAVSAEASGARGAAVFGGGGQPLPEGLDVNDIDSLEITTADDEPVLFGTTALAKFVQTGSFPLTPAGAALLAKGDVAFGVKQKDAKSKTTFLMFAKKLPASTKLVLKVNGVAVRNVKTDSKGLVLVVSGNATLPLKGDGTPKTKVTSLPTSVDVSAIQTVELDTTDGQVAATGGFETR